MLVNVDYQLDRIAVYPGDKLHDRLVRDLYRLVETLILSVRDYNSQVNCGRKLHPPCVAPLHDWGLGKNEVERKLSTNNYSSLLSQCGYKVPSCLKLLSSKDFLYPSVALVRMIYHSIRKRN